MLLSNKNIQRNMHKRNKVQNAISTNTGLTDWLRPTQHTTGHSRDEF